MRKRSVTIWTCRSSMPAMRFSKRMGRRTTKAQLKEIVAKLRKEIPDIVLRTTLIAGFPGETQEQHEELMEFVG